MNSILRKKQVTSSLFLLSSATSRFLHFLSKKSVTIIPALLLGLSLVLTGFLIIQNLLLLASLQLITLLGCTFVYVTLARKNRKVTDRLWSLNDRLSGEASASRILQGVKLLNRDDSSSAESRLAIAARTATNYDAVIIFNLQHAHGALIPSHWSYKGQLDNIEAEFEPLTESSPGASAVKQGSALVISTNDTAGVSIPAWARQSGFTQGIVSPIFDGLDTVGVIYALNKKASIPTLLEIEQLELILSFRSMIPNSHTPSMFKEGFRTFDVTNNLDVGTRTPEKSIKNLTIGNFSLNAELGQMELSGTAISLTPTEFLLMHTLASSSGVPVSPATLMSSCWEEGTRPSERALDVAIFRLRKKLKTILAHTSLIKTVRGSGYMFDMSDIKVDSAAAAL